MVITATPFTQVHFVFTGYFYGLHRSISRRHYLWQREAGRGVRRDSFGCQDLDYFDALLTGGHLDHYVRAERTQFLGIFHHLFFLSEQTGVQLAGDPFESAFRSFVHR